MSDGRSGSGPRAATGPISVDRPTRIQELREAAGDEAGEATGDAMGEEHEGPRPAPSPAAARPARPDGAVLGVNAGASPTEGRPTPRRAGLLIGALAGVVVLVVVGALVIVGRSSTDSTAGATPPAAAGLPSASSPPAPGVSPGAPELAPPTTSAVAAVPRPVGAADRNNTLCDAVTVYSIDDLLQLGRNIAADPTTFLAAYETLVAQSPADVKGLLEQMGPLTRKAVAAAQTGAFASAADVQAWLARQPAPELEAWVAPQQELAPKLKAACGRT